MMSKQFTAAEVASHNLSSDCWVVINGDVIDVTTFLEEHPGGASVLCGKGRAGGDVTCQYESIGHSDSADEIVRSLRVGVLSKSVHSVSSTIDRVVDNETFFGEDETMALIDNHCKEVESVGYVSTDHDYAAMWHANRRRAIKRDHPEVAALIGHNNFTSFIGLSTVIVHACTCIYVQRSDVSFLMTLFLAYTVGAICKMYQFAVNHDLCHNTAGWIFERSDLLKRTAMQLLTLPSVGGATHTYYEFQHLGHHVALGSVALGDLTDIQTPNGLSQLTLSGVRKLLLFPDSDGDVFTIGTLSMGRILFKWERVGLAAGAGVDVDAASKDNSDIESVTTPRQYIENHLLTWFHDLPAVKKFCLVQLLHIQHHAGMAFVLLQTLVVIPLISVPMFLFPDYLALFFRRYCWTVLLKKAAEANRDKPLSARFSDDVLQFLLSFALRVGSSVGLHSWLWVGSLYYLLFCCTTQAGLVTWTFTSVIKGYIYLYLSELFLYGFGMHPYMGYFLGVHRSGGEGFGSLNSRRDVNDASKSAVVAAADDDNEDDTCSRRYRSSEGQAAGFQGCQPTMSTYGYLSAFFSMNLTHHVEHHDFPGVPWNRLPELTRIAPEYYENLESSPGFYFTVKQWAKHSGQWGYACQ